MPEVAAPYSETSDARDEERAGFVAAADVADSISERAEEYIDAYALLVSTSENAEV